jgi:hypothetical protein
MFGLLNNPLGCSPILLTGGDLYSGNDRAGQHFELN